MLCGIYGVGFTVQVQPSTSNRHPGIQSHHALKAGNQGLCLFPSYNAALKGYEPIIT